MLARACVVCRHHGETDLCADCVGRLVPGPDEPDGLVDGCPPLAALLAYDETSAALVLAIKRQGLRALARRLGRALGALADPAAVDLVTWAPTAGARRRERGFDQAQLLAGAAAATLGLRAEATLRRRPGPPQARRSGSERRRHPGFDLVRRPPTLVDRCVLLVDDVATTGATLAAASAVLESAGASVTAIVVAVAPVPRSSSAA